MLVLNHVSLRRGAKVVLDRASVTLQPGREGRPGRPQRRRQVVAVRAARRHACTPTPAMSRMPPRWRIGRGRAGHARDRRGRDRLRARRRHARCAEAEAELAARRGQPTTATRWRDAHQAISDAGGFDARPRAQALLLGLGFKIGELDAPVNSFSGGWRMRLQLARALMCPSDLLLLDEPTNHLDLDALVWLEAWLKRYDGHDDRDQPRPRVPRRGHQRHAAPRRRPS